MVVYWVKICAAAKNNQIYYDVVPLVELTQKHGGRIRIGFLLKNGIYYTNLNGYYTDGRSRYLYNNEISCLEQGLPIFC